jgi:hypothetical protein
VLSKILLVALLGVLVVKMGFLSRLRNLKPRLDRAVNITIAVIAVAYVGQFLWWLIQGRAAH